MANENKLQPVELACILLIALILLFFPYLMISEHSQDAVANSYYHDGR